MRNDGAAKSVQFKLSGFVGFPVIGQLPEEFGNGFGSLLRRGADFFLLQAQKHDSVEQFEALIELFSDAGAVFRTVLGALFDKIGEHFVVELAIVGKLLGSEERFVEFCQRFYDIEVDL